MKTIKRWYTYDSEGRLCHPYIKNDGEFFKVEDVLPLLQELERRRHPLMKLPSASEIDHIMHTRCCSHEEALEIYRKNAISDAYQKSALMRMQELDGEKP